MNIIRAIVDGERDGVKLSESLHHPQMKSSKQDLAKALQGNWKREHLFCLKQALSCYDFAVEQMRLCEIEIERSLDEINGGDGTVHQGKKGQVRQNDYSFNAAVHLNAIAGTNLTAIDGLEEKSLVTIFSEVGTDLSKWQTAAHFSSWLGLSPRPKKTGDKTRGHDKGSVSGRAGKAFKSAAASLHHSKSQLGAFYRKIAYRKGGIAAVKATARKIAVIFWNVMTSGCAYRSETAISYEQKQEAFQLKKLQKQAAKFGLTLQRLNE